MDHRPLLAHFPAHTLAYVHIHTHIHKVPSSSTPAPYSPPATRPNCPETRSETRERERGAREKGESSDRGMN